MLKKTYLQNQSETPVSIPVEILSMIAVGAGALILLLFLVGLSPAEASPLGGAMKGLKLASSAMSTTRQARAMIPESKHPLPSLGGNGGEIAICARSAKDGKALGLPACSSGCLLESNHQFQTECEGAMAVSFYTPKAPKGEKKSKE